jgi:hypothetical protein
MFTPPLRGSSSSSSAQMTDSAPDMPFRYTRRMNSDAVRIECDPSRIAGPPPILAQLIRDYVD